MEASGVSRARALEYDPTPLELLAGVSPAAGANFALAMPPREGWELVAVFFQLVTDATVANRGVTVDYVNTDGQVFVSHGTGFVVTAGTTQTFSFCSAYATAISNTVGQAFAPLLPVVFQRSQQLQINVFNKAVGDQLSQIRLAFKRRRYAPS